MKLKESPSKLCCKLCGSTHLVKFGCYHGIQRWWCKDCRHKFADNNAIPDMKTPAEQVASAINMYFCGIRLQHIPRLLFRKYGAFVSYTSVYNWIIHFSQLAFTMAENSRLKTGNTWLIYESPAHNDIKDIRLSVLDVVDVSTGFLLATGISHNRSQYDVKALMVQAKERAGRIPASVLTDGWIGYVHGINLALGGRAKKVRVIPLEDNNCEKLLLYWPSAAANRARIISGLKKESTTLLVLDGWHIHYNYFTASEALEGTAPAAAAGADYKFRSWLDIIQSSGR
jgi:transposase-like protein